VSADAVEEESTEVAWKPSPGLQRAALAFSAMPTRAALNISARLTLVERNRLREGLSHVRNVAEHERRDAVQALVRAVHSGVGFPAPAPHDEAKCPFRRIEATPAADVAAVLGACARTAPIVAATALCHLRAAYRAEVWGGLDAEERSAIRPVLSQIPGLSPTRTAMYALDLRDRIAHRR
jgi:hypothetical protein